jgi:hypothetical protein
LPFPYPRGRVFLPTQEETSIMMTNLTDPIISSKFDALNAKYRAETAHYSTVAAQLAEKLGVTVIEDQQHNGYFISSAEATRILGSPRVVR